MMKRLFLAAVASIALAGSAHAQCPPYCARGASAYPAPIAYPPPPPDPLAALFAALFSIFGGLPLVPDGMGGWVPFANSRVMPDGTLRPYDPAIDGGLAPPAFAPPPPVSRRAAIPPAPPAAAPKKHPSAPCYDENGTFIEPSSPECRGPKTGTVVPNSTGEPAGTIIINTDERLLYIVEADGTSATRYGIAVGREGFTWKGAAQIGRKTEWPRWFPPKDMLARRPDLPEHMEGGPNNPLGARALYLFQGDKDTLFRIHGTNEPDSIGKAVSSGCIRMMNADVIDLYDRVEIGARVVVL